MRPAAAARWLTYASSGMRLLHGDPLLILQPQVRSINPLHFCSSSLNVSSIGCSEDGIDPMQVQVLFRMPHTNSNKTGKVLICVSLFSELMEALLISRIEFSAVEALLTSRRGFTEAVGLA